MRKIEGAGSLTWLFIFRTSLPHHAIPVAAAVSLDVDLLQIYIIQKKGGNVIVFFFKCKVLDQFSVPWFCIAYPRLHGSRLISCRAGQRKLYRQDF